MEKKIVLVVNEFQNIINNGFNISQRGNKLNL